MILTTFVITVIAIVVGVLFGFALGIRNQPVLIRAIKRQHEEIQQRKAQVEMAQKAIGYYKAVLLIRDRQILEMYAINAASVVVKPTVFSTN